MKKFLLWGLIGVLALSLLGCSKKASEINDVIHNETFTGIVEELPGIVDDIDATHVLLTTDKNRVYLRSLLYNLDEFLEQEVEVYGNYYQETLNDKPIDILTVSSILSLEPKVEVSVNKFSSTDLGISFDYDKSKFNIDVSSTRIIITDKLSSAVFNFKVNKIGPEMDVALYKKEVLSNVSLSNFSHSKYRISSNIDTDESKIVFLIEKDDYFYEFATVSFGSLNHEEIKNIMMNVLDTLTLNEVKSTFFDVKIDEAFSITTDNEKNEDSKSNNENKSVMVEVENVNIDPSYVQAMNSFISNSSTLLPEFMTPVSYAFTDTGYFYITYMDKDSSMARALIKYNANNFDVVARFKRGTTVDWELVYGNNVASEASQTLILISSDGTKDTVNVKQGYRYFESLPLGFGLQYPKHWYYSRDKDTYLFANKPFEKGEEVLTVELVKKSFSSVDGNKVTDGILKQTTDGNLLYFVKLNNFYIEVKGSTEYSQQIDFMARSIRELNLDN